MGKKVIWVLVFIAVAAIGYWVGSTVCDQGQTESFAARSTMDGHSCYPVYGLDVNSMKEQVLVCFPISDTLDAEGKLRVLADRLSTSVYGRLPIEVLSIDNRSGQWVAKVNLQEVRDANGFGGWYVRFQGSTGGAQTQYGLVQTFLQREYKGKWIDGVEFYYDGKPFTEEWDHINLAGVKMRNEMKAQTGSESVL